MTDRTIEQESDPERKYRRGKPIQEARDLGETDLRRIARSRARSLASQLPPRPKEKEAQEAMLLPLLELTEAAPAAEISTQFEKVHDKAEFLPARFLLVGSQRAKAVCRITGPEGRGTGFLVGPGLLMTNNHVIKTAAEARDSVAEFGFAEGESVVRVGFNPERLFVTDERLDFTIVACDQSGIADYPTIPLLRNPAVVAPGERVSIIQHPRGRAKEVALHDNKATAVKDLVVHYRTDTEPGSSGSPVFNVNWDLVALHHAGWDEPDGAATNEGVRISAIVAHLIAGLNGGQESNREALWEVLSAVPDSSPYLGFFDAHGATGDWREVEVPDFAGTRTFADIGFWNIEHFNDGITDERVSDVGEVVARLSMDALGLVEVQAGALDRLVQALSRRGLSYGVVVHDVGGAQDLAVLFDRDTTRVTLRDDLLQTYSGELAAKTPAGKTAFPRTPLFAECVVDEGAGAEVRFMMIALHLKAFGDAESRARRRLAAEKLGEIVADLRGQGHAVIIGGDLNEELNSGFLSGLTDAADLFALTTDDDTDGAISYVGGSHRSLIDHIVISSDVKPGDISGDDAAIVRLDQSVSDFSARISDHVPIVLRVVYRDDGGVDVGGTPDEPEGVEVEVPAGSRSVRLRFE